MPTLNWIGKEAVVKHHKDVPYRLLERVPELDCGDSDSGNMIVQGDNLHALKALLPRYAGQVKCIYIDPPYNTGNEGWVYCDNVNSPEIRKWLNSVVGKEGETLDRHDRWLCMMYPRLLLLKQFLRDDGVIFISIDDNELATLKLLCDSIFTANCFVGTFVWRRRTSSAMKADLFSTDHEYVLAYAMPSFTFLGVGKTYSGYANPDGDARGDWTTGDLTVGMNKDQRPNQFFDLIDPATGKSYPANPNRVWSFIPESMNKLIAEQRVIFPDSTKQQPKLKRFKNELKRDTNPVSTWLADVGLNAQGSREIQAILGEQAFQYSKPRSLIEHLLQVSAPKDSIILDSFAGSGTTAHAVLNLNKQDGGNRSVILVEMDETIAETITAERNRRVIEGYKNAKGEPVEGLGCGFQFYRLSKEPLFTADGQVRPDVTFAQLAEFVWFKETGTGFTGCADSPLLGVFNNSAVYLLYNGILGDSDPEKGNVLTPSIYKNLPPFQGRKIIYATACRGGDSWLNREQIVLKQTPYELNV